jgi:3-methyladenine DNA glycosylase AlkD
MGSAQTRKTYGRHGVTSEMYGVKHGDLKKLANEIKTDHELALELWETGNFDARVLATMIANPDKITAKTLNGWVKDVDDHGMSYAVSTIAGRSPAGRKLLPKWMNAKGEWPAATGWMALTDVVAEPGALTVDESRELLSTIEDRIHGSKNRVKYSMNTAMIALGTYVPGMEKEAIKVAERIGPVEVDHGPTSCKTPLAAPYIRKAAAHQRAKLAKARKKKASKRA